MSALKCRPKSSLIALILKMRRETLPKKPAPPTDLRPLIQIRQRLQR
ncbi:MAG: hypothetical protein NZM04_00770 [Methylacidiphilales bacterium]|nr:hypothetical protein [Candidatus Methylacidiphilales bacterium]